MVCRGRGRMQGKRRLPRRPNQDGECGSPSRFWICFLDSVFQIQRQIPFPSSKENTLLQCAHKSRIMRTYKSLLPGDDGYLEDTYQLNGERDGQRFWLWTAIGALAISALLSLLFLVSSWTESFNTLSPPSENTTVSDDMKLQIIIPSFVGYSAYLLIPAVY